MFVRIKRRVEKKIPSCQLSKNYYCLEVFIFFSAIILIFEKANTFIFRVIQKRKPDFVL